MEESEATLKTLRHLRSLGVRVALDDFGTGYSSLSYLSSFPFDKLKIDRSFVSGLGTNPDCAAIVRAIVGLGTSLGMTITAEGVETPAQLDFIRAVGCSEAQGYLIDTAATRRRRRPHPRAGPLRRRGVERDAEKWTSLFGRTSCSNS